MGPQANSEMGRRGCGGGGPKSPSRSPVHATGSGGAQRRAVPYGNPEEGAAHHRTSAQRLAQARRVVAGFEQLDHVEGVAGEVIGDEPGGERTVAALGRVEQLAVALGLPRLRRARDVHAPVALGVIGELRELRVDARARRRREPAVEGGVRPCQRA